MGWSTLIGGVSNLVFEPIRHPVPRSKPELMDLILDIRYQAILHLIGCLLEPKKFASIFTIGTRSVLYIRFSVTADFGYKGPRQLIPYIRMFLITDGNYVHFEQTDRKVVPHELKVPYIRSLLYIRLCLTLLIYLFISRAPSLLSRCYPWGPCNIPQSYIKQRHIMIKI